MIIGIGVDLVDIDRFGASLRRAPRLAEKLFVPSERGRPLHSMAARFAAKEAFAKALGSPRTMKWHDSWVVGGGQDDPYFEWQGTVAERCDELGVTRVNVSMAHDGGFAIAYVVAEGEG